MVVVIDSSVPGRVARLQPVWRKCMTTTRRPVSTMVLIGLSETNTIGYYYDYLRLLNVMTTVGMPRAPREAQAATLRQAGHPASLARAEGLEMDAAAYVRLVTRRERARDAWRDFFRAWDVVLAPMTLDVAFPHQEAAFEERRLLVDNQSLP